MRWYLLNLRRGDVMGILFMVMVLGGLVAGFYLRHSSLQDGGNGFGPEWDCTANARGEAICIKKIDQTR
jgi:hypothetical protein